MKDDEYNPGQALIAAKSLVQSHVAAIIANSDELPAWLSVASQAGVPVVGAQDFTQGYTSADVFPPGGTSNYAIVASALMAKNAGITKVASLYCVEVAACQEGSATQASVSAKHGVKYVYRAGISFSAPNYTAECLAAKQAGATGMWVGDASAIVASVAKSCATQGYTPTQFSGDGIVAIGWLKIPAFNGTIAYQPNLPWFVKNKATAAMYAALDKYAPDVPAGPNFGEEVVQNWAAGVLVQEAVRAASPSAGTAVTPAVVKKGLYSLPAGENLGGLAAQTISFKKGQLANFNCFYIMGIKNGKFVQKQGGKPLCVPLMKPGWSPS